MFPVLKSAALLYEEALLFLRRFIGCQPLVVFDLDRSMENGARRPELQPEMTKSCKIALTISSLRRLC